MTGTLERRNDGSFALSINGDLQFDSVDERIYHECLVLPALAISSRRIESGLRVLIVGGGDGLCAREVFKCSRVAHIDLVDYDPDILQMGTDEFSTLNENSFADPRLTVHARDAWTFVSEAVRDSARYDLIISDLTVPEDIESARFHSVQWYSMLAALAGERGVVATNGLSPQATPWAFCSVFNSMLSASLHARPYHVRIPSFTARGYGDDWGFFIGSRSAITREDFLTADLPEPRFHLMNNNQLSDLFILPEELFAVQPVAQPAFAGSGILLRYFQKGELTAISGSVRDALGLVRQDLIIPEADTGAEILPLEVSAAFAKLLDRVGKNGGADSEQPADAQAVLRDILQLVPSLHRSQTPEMVEEFLNQPESFLQSVDLAALVSRVLQRAGSSLPANVVAELQVLAGKLADWTGDQLSFSQMGNNVVALLALLLIIGNLMYPDAVYAKDGHHAAHPAHASAKAAGHHRGARPNDRGRRLGERRNGWAWNGGGWIGEDEWLRNHPEKVIINNKKVVPAKKPIEPEIRNYGSYNNDGGTRDMLIGERDEVAAYLAMLKEELSAYLESEDETVTFGMSLVPRAEAVHSSRQLIAKAETKLQAIFMRLDALAAESTDSLDA